MIKNNNINITSTIMNPPHTKHSGAHGHTLLDAQCISVQKDRLKHPSCGTHVGTCVSIDGLHGCSDYPCAVHWSRAEHPPPQKVNLITKQVVSGSL